MTKAATAIIDCGLIRDNLAVVRRNAPNAKVMAIIKANGYGHGIIAIAQTLQQADAFGVACIEEAAVLRDNDIETPVVMLSGCQDKEELAFASAKHISIVVHHEHQVQMLETTKLARPVSVWLKVDTGMHRLGVSIAAAGSIYERLLALPNIVKPIGLMTHLAYADDRRDPRTKHQFELFKQLPVLVDAPRSVSNSAGILAWPEFAQDWVRPGIMLYGASPFTGRLSAQEGLTTAMTLTTTLISTQSLRKGQAVGYGGAWVAPSDRQIGIAAIGYGDGYPRHAPSGTPVLVNNQRASIVGRVSMDMICIDLHGITPVHPGDPVVLWGGAAAS